MQLQCMICVKSFELSAKHYEMFERFDVEPIAECFRCNQRHKLAFRNGRALYRRTCDATGESIVSIYPADAPYTVYAHDYWYGDKWDPLSFGQAFDFSRSFFSQLQELQCKVPRMALFNVNAENSDYCNMAAGNKNSYCVFGGDFNQDTMYGTLCMHNRSSVDIDYSNLNELCYDVFNSFDCYGCRSVVDSKNCSDCGYVSDCIGCKDCILCVNLQNAQYCIRGKQLSREEYEAQRKRLLNGSAEMHQQLLQEFRDLRSTRIVRFAHLIASEDCSGDFIENSKDCSNCFFCSGSQDCTDGIFLADASDACMSSFFGHHGGIGFNTMSCVQTHDCLGCFFAIGGSNLRYCDTVIGCNDCFGCYGLRQKRYCILNKQYAKEEYEVLLPKVVAHMKQSGEWGRYFPIALSCFAYNESTAMEFFPLTKAEAIAKGFCWRDQLEEPAKAEKTIDASQLPDAVADTPDAVLNWAIRCEVTGRIFRIIKQELAFYCTHSLPLPRVHPDERYYDRFRNYANRPEMFDRACGKCRKAIRTTYSLDRPEIVYCEECYLKEVY